jgi:hypothetical protein
MTCENTKKNCSFINLTPHAISLYDQDNKLKETIPSSGFVRCLETTKVIDHIGDYPVLSVVFGEVEGLPPFQEGVYLIVSKIVLEALHGTRNDCVCVSDTVRDENNRIIGAKAFSRL